MNWNKILWSVMLVSLLTILGLGSCLIPWNLDLGGWGWGVVAIVALLILLGVLASAITWAANKKRRRLAAQAGAQANQQSWNLTSLMPSFGAVGRVGRHWQPLLITVGILMVISMTILTGNLLFGNTEWLKELPLVMWGAFFCLILAFMIKQVRLGPGSTDAFLRTLMRLLVILPVLAILLYLYRRGDVAEVWPAKTNAQAAATGQTSQKTSSTINGVKKLTGTSGTEIIPLQPGERSGWYEVPRYARMHRKVTGKITVRTLSGKEYPDGPNIFRERDSKLSVEDSTYQFESLENGPLTVILIWEPDPNPS